MAPSGLIRYLLGPGRAQEHTNPRVIAAKYEDARTSGLEVDVEPKPNRVKLTVEKHKR